MCVAPEHNRKVERETTKTMKTTTLTKIDSSSCQLIFVNCVVALLSTVKSLSRQKQSRKKQTKHS